MTCTVPHCIVTSVLFLPLILDPSCACLCSTAFQIVLCPRLNIWFNPVFLCKQSCPGSDLLGGARRRQLLSHPPHDGVLGQQSHGSTLSQTAFDDMDDASLHSALLSLEGGNRKLLQQKNYPNYPNDAGEALAIFAIHAQALRAVFALVHWFINTNNYIVSALARLMHD